MTRKRKKIRITIMEVDAAQRDLLEQGRERMSHPKPVESQLPTPPEPRRVDIGEHEPKPTRRVTPIK